MSVSEEPRAENPYNSANRPTEDRTRESLSGETGFVSPKFFRQIAANSRIAAESAAMIKNMKRQPVLSVKTPESTGPIAGANMMTKLYLIEHRQKGARNQRRDCVFMLFGHIGSPFD
jgi:hypothetical protein